MISSRDTDTRPDHDGEKPEPSPAPDPGDGGSGPEAPEQPLAWSGPSEGGPPAGAPPGGPPGDRRWLTRRRIVIGAVLLLAFAGAAAAGSTLGWLLTFDIPEVQRLQDWNPPVVTTLYSAGGDPLQQFGSEKRIVVGLDQVPQEFIDALVSTEDARFYDHVGIDPWGIARAIIKDITHLRKAQGGSTITQQLARSLFLKPEKTWRRKLQEMVLALQVEKSFTKNEILTFYVNQVYMGHGRYGIEAAARYYFGHPARDLSLAESALLAGLVQRPEAYSPVRSPERSMARRNHVLHRMVRERRLAREAASLAVKEPVTVTRAPEDDTLAPYFVEEVRRYLDATYGEVALYQEGLEVYTTLDPDLQRAANEAVFNGLRALDKRRGWRGDLVNVAAEGGDPATWSHPGWGRPPEIGRLRWGVVTSTGRAAATVRLGEWTASVGPEAVSWTGHSSPSRVLKVGDTAPFLVKGIDGDRMTLDVSIDQEPEAEAALLALDAATGEIVALVGGWDFSRSQFDRAIQSYRQAGSAFKPFIYASALEAGYSLAQSLFDEPTVFVDQATGDQYQPNNYYKRYYGTMTLREAMEESRNIVAVKLLNEVGYGRTIDTARRMGISSQLRPYPSMALGTMEVSLIDLTTAFSVFANQGIRVEPHFIRRVVDREGRIREEAKPRIVEALRADVAYLMTFLLQGVTEAGTGAAAQSLHSVVAGKTGTTDDLADAWFVGFSPSLVVGVWVGFDQKRSLGEGETGARAALPIWIETMRAALAARPPEKFPRPAGVVYAAIDRRTGLLATADSKCPVPFLEAFIEGTEPIQPCSEVEHYRISLPYYLQRFEINRDLELRIDAETVVRLVSEGAGDLDLAEDGRELLLHEEDGTRRIRLDMRRRDRREAREQIEAGMTPAGEEGSAPAGPIPEYDAPVGLDGRPATLIPIRAD